MTQILTNYANNSIILTLNNTLSPDSSIVSLDPGESLLYDSVAVTNSLDPNYNVPLLQDYIDNGVVVLETLTAKHQSELQLLPQTNVTVGLSSGVPELVGKLNTVTTDNLQLLPVTDTLGRVLCIYYKSVEGMLISTDLGKTQSLISNDNLVFPDEITSFAVQTYESNGGVLVPVSRLYIGTLREGIKTFTPGVDSTYKDFDADTNFNDDTYPLFKNCEKTINLLNTTKINTSGGVPDNKWWPPEIKINYTSYCPTYILGVVNNPSNSGCPIFIASRPKYTVTTIINQTFTDGVLTDHPSPIVVIWPDHEYRTKIAVKFLHEKFYISGAQVDTPGSSSSNRWIRIQENAATQSGIGSVIIPPIFPQHLLDVITEYTADGMLFIAKDDVDANSLYKVVCSTDITAPISITTIALPTALQSGQLRHISQCVETGTSNYDIFITTMDTVWRYSSVSSSWSEFIGRNSLNNYLSTTIDEGIFSGVYGGLASFALNKMTLTRIPSKGKIVIGQKLSSQDIADDTVIQGLTSGVANEVGAVYSLSTTPGTIAAQPFTSYVSFLKDLSGFVLVPKDSLLNEYIGLLGTEIGVILYNLRLVNNVFITEAKNGRSILYNIAKSGISDIKVAIDSKAVYAFICSYASQIPRVFYNNMNCLQLINEDSDLTKHVIYMKPDVETTTDSPYYVNADSLVLNAIPTNEQKAYIPTLIDTNYTYDLISPRQAFKLKSLTDTQDDILLTALGTFLAHKYYFPFITERIISSVNKMEKAVDQLDEYKHEFRIHDISSLNYNESGSITGMPTVVVKVLQATLPIFLDNGHTRNGIVCVRFDGKIILPESIIQTLTKRYIATQQELIDAGYPNTAEGEQNYHDDIGFHQDQWQARLTFAEEFTGTLFVQDANNYWPVTVSGLFSIIEHNNGGYPQVQLDPSVQPLLNDIKYIDGNRLEISFKSRVNTEVILTTLASG